VGGTVFVPKQFTFLFYKN
jgi:hypothetical protein